MISEDMLALRQTQRVLADAFWSLNSVVVVTDHAGYRQLARVNSTKRHHHLLRSFSGRLEMVTLSSEVIAFLEATLLLETAPLISW